jgi:arsenate reductase
MKNVLFLCTGNSCRSIMAEGILNHHGKGKFRAFSAGSFPSGKVHPMSIVTLSRHGMQSLGYESKSWDIFKDLVDLDIVITVCDNAAGEQCPIFPGTPVKTHWGAPDPAHFQGTQAEIGVEFDRVFGILERRIKALVALPVESMDKATLIEKLNAIGAL